MNYDDNEYQENVISYHKENPLKKKQKMQIRKTSINIKSPPRRQTKEDPKQKY